MCLVTKESTEVRNVISGYMKSKLLQGEKAEQVRMKLVAMVDHQYFANQLNVGTMHQYFRYLLSWFLCRMYALILLDRNKC